MLAIDGSGGAQGREEGEELDEGLGVHFAGGWRVTGLGEKRLWGWFRVGWKDEKLLLKAVEMILLLLMSIFRGSQCGLYTPSSLSTFPYRLSAHFIAR